MPRYMVSWKANASVWPTDPKQALAVLEGAIGGGEQLLKGGAAKELNWFTPQEGYGIFEADSKATVLGAVHGFFPYYSQEVREVAPWESASKAMLDSARQAAAR
jgi:hypothetical protein